MLKIVLAYLQSAFVCMKSAFLNLQSALSKLRRVFLSMKSTFAIIESRIVYLQSIFFNLQRAFANLKSAFSNLKKGVFTELCLPYIFLEKIYTCLLGYFYYKECVLIKVCVSGTQLFVLYIKCLNFVLLGQIAGNEAGQGR